MIVNERRGRVAQSDVLAFLQELSRLNIAIDRVPNELELLFLARHHSLTIYDAAYLELAKRDGLLLATLDKELFLAAQAESDALLS